MIRRHCFSGVCMMYMMYDIRIFYLFHFGAVVVAVVVVVAIIVVEVCRNASPENRCRYCLVNDFNGLAVDDIVAVFSDGWVVCVPLFEIDVNIVIAYCLLGVGIGVVGVARLCDRSLPFWKNELFRLDDDFIYFSKPRLVNDGC